MGIYLTLSLHTKFQIQAFCNSEENPHRKKTENLIISQQST